MIKCFEANYPESLGSIIVYRSPWIFQGIWKIIRGWLDPVVAGKVHFAKNVDELEKFVPRSRIIADLGGDDPWTYEYVEPVEGENAAMGDATQREALLAKRGELVKQYETSVLKWVVDGDKDKSPEERRKERDAGAEALRGNYWELDPFVRARSLWDRTGVLGEGGKLEFYPEANGKKGSKKEEVVTSADDVD